MIDKAREIALKVLYKVEKENAYSNIALDNELKNNMAKLNNKDIGLISQIVYGVTTWRLTLDTIIEKHSKIKLKKISPWILNILRMGIYQIIFLNKIPKFSAVDESVNLAKKYGHQKSAGFVNAILRKISLDDYKDLFKIENKKEKISKTQSMPIWIIEELLKNNTLDEVEKICENLNLKPELSVRVNTLKTTKEELIKKLQNKNIKCNNGDLEDFIILKDVKNIENMEEFKKGLFTIQDESAGLTAVILDPKEGQNVLDACSAPGGKTTYMAEIMKNHGKIDAWDIHEHRLKLIEENCKRLGITIVNTQINDATKVIDNSIKYDKILLDVPCLGIGVIKRKPDIKWQRKPEDVIEISKIQNQILENCAKKLKKGGELVYSTCSILKEENENIIEKFLVKNQDFEIIKITDSKLKYLKIMPNKFHDGFFICKMRKKF